MIHDSPGVSELPDFLHQINWNGAVLGAREGGWDRSAEAFTIADGVSLKKKHDSGPPKSLKRRRWPKTPDVFQSLNILRNSES